MRNAKGSAGATVGIVASRFNEDVTTKLLDNCVRTLEAAGVPKAAIEVVRVPGAFEIPWAAQELALAGRCSVVIALGCILKGQTTQNEHMARSTILALHQLSLSTRVPCVLGVITPDTHLQAMSRTGGALDRGKEAAQAALALLEVRRSLSAGSEA